MKICRSLEKAQNDYFFLLCILSYIYLLLSPHSAKLLKRIVFSLPVYLVAPIPSITSREGDNAVQLNAV